MRFKVLTLDDFKECEALLESTHNDKYPVPTRLMLDNYYYEDDEPLCSIFGCFDDANKLVSCVFTTFVGYDKSYLIDYAIKDPSANINCLMLLFKYIMDYCEDSGYNSFYATYFERHDIAWERLASRKLEYFSRYTITTEVVIPANKRSSFYKYWRECQKGVIYRRPIRVKMYSLKEEYRIF